MHQTFGGSAHLFAIIKFFSFAFFRLFILQRNLFYTPVTSSNLRNPAPLFTELRLLQDTCRKYWKHFTVVLKMIDFIDKKQMCDSVITGK